MKILLVHDHYRSSAPSGEDQVFRNELTLLKKHGVDVTTFERFNDDINDSSRIKRLKLARDTAWSPTTYQDLSELVSEIRPDIAHFHNTFPLISPSAYLACREYGVPVVQTLHNFRLICPGALLIRDGRPCEDCVGTNLLPALRYRCYRGSLPATGALVWMLMRNRWHGTYTTLVNRYIALTEFAAGRLIAGGLPRDRMSVKPNFSPNISAPGTGDGGYVVYVGRLSEEKGVRTLLTAWKLVAGIPLKIMGDGPLRKELELRDMRDHISVEFLGFCDRPTIVDIVGRATFQIIPSEWYEGFPMVVVEAYACGTPVVASRIGSLDEIVEEGATGLKFEPGNPRDLSDKVSALWADRALQTMLRRTARESFEMKFSGEKKYETLTAIYEAAIKDYAQATKG